MADDEPEPLDHHPLSGLNDNHQALLRLLGGARYAVDLFSLDLEPPLYGREDVAEAMRTFLVSSPRARLRVLVRNGMGAVQGATMLIELVRRLTDRAEIRRIPREYRDRLDTFLLVDRGGVLYRPIASAYEGMAGHDPVRWRDLHALFNTVWEQAERDPEVRRLHI